MNYRFSFLLIIIIISTTTLLSFKKPDAQQIIFDTFFEPHSLRIDYYLVGDAEKEDFILQQLKKTEHWAGKKKLITIDSLNLGNFRFNLFDSATNKLLYTKGFSSLFQEWQTTKEAKAIKKSFYHVNVMPFPKRMVKYQLQKRDYETGEFINLHEFYINPTDYFIINEKATSNKYTQIHGNNGSDKKIDIAFLAEGYQKKEMGKFRKDVKRMWEYFSSIPPFNQYSDNFNIYAVESLSQETGTDNPGASIYKNTALDFSFYTFNIDRYLTSSNIKVMHDAAEVVPYDQIFVLINSAEYGGGGFYNYYSASTTDNELSLKVAIHEFGHGFAGLADEYYSSNVAYDGFYNLNVEPWEPNITTLVNFDKKWPDIIDSNTPIPTERISKHCHEVGVFEGGGYSAKGIYSPFQDCRMKSNLPRGFCPVCSKTIVDIINHYSE